MWRSAAQVLDDFLAAFRFDPQGAVSLWQNMIQAGGNRAPEFLSTHPSHGSRIEGLNAFMDEAMAAGAIGVAVVGAIMQARDPEAAAARIRRALEAGG